MKTRKKTKAPARRKRPARPASAVEKAQAAGKQYAFDQIGSDYFSDWVRDQLLEASKMPPDKVLPLETKADAEAIAKNMLKQLEWDTKRELRGDDLVVLLGPSSAARPDDTEPSPLVHVSFYDGFREACDASRDWLADELLEIKQGMRGARASETRETIGGRYSLRQSPDNALIYKAFFGTLEIGYVAGPYQYGNSDFYQWRLNGDVPSFEHQFGRSPVSGRGKTQTAAFNALIHADKERRGTLPPREGDSRHPKAKRSARRRR